MWPLLLWVCPLVCITNFQLMHFADRGLRIDGTQFTLEGKPFTILSGSIHYFRVLRQYWKDRLLSLKAAGLNTVETYVAWNLHEEYPGEWDYSGEN
uniref:Glycoside hydrolase 35 catalytic domain-containing protein n=1 Tax=Romanomermis culicivorax TaxID=13658 RepID=A0A915HRS0_ROMCU